MESKDNTIHIHIEIIDSSTFELQFCPDFLMIYGLRGKTEIITGKKRYVLERGGLLNITPFFRFEIRCASDSGVAVMHVPQDILQIVDAGSRLPYVHCYSRGSAPGIHGEYDAIRANYAQIFQLCFQHSGRGNARAISYLSHLLGDLTAHFLSSEAPEKTRNDRANYERCDRILRYIHRNWRENISIEKIAADEYVSVGYLSRFFKKNMGVTLSEYLIDLRLRNAVRDVLNTDDTITQIALNSGFKNTNSFIHYFKLRFGRTPKQFRRSYAAEPKQQDPGQLIPENSGVQELLDYIPMQDLKEHFPEMAVDNRSILIDAGRRGRSLRHTWKRLLNIGYARDGLSAEVQDQILKVQKEIGFEYVRFHGILDDDMHVYFENEEGRVHLDFARIDLLLDFMISAGLKLFIEFSYMPRALAANSTSTFDREVHISSFKREENWRALISGFLQHVIERYGRKEVLSWKFSAIDINSVVGGMMPMEEYLKLYHTTYSCVKEADNRLSFGGPGGFVFNAWNGNILSSFFDYTKENQCIPDFICTQCFPHSSIDVDQGFWKYTLSQTSSPAVLSEDIHYMKTALTHYRKLLSVNNLSDRKIWVEEWNSTIWQRDLSGDTCYKAAWLTKNICENYDDVEAFGYWSLTDFFEEVSDFGSVYHGGYGLFTYNGIPKSGWHAMRFLNMLGDVKVGGGDGWMATKSDEGIQLLMDHYCHYDGLYCLRYRKLTDPEKAYSVFSEDVAHRFKITIEGLEKGKYEVRRYKISRKYGSSFDNWIAMGMPSYLNAEEKQYLERVSQPKYEVEAVEIESRYVTESELNPHEVQIIILKILN